MSKQIVVVEGIHDQEKINKAFPNLTVLTTGGSAVSSSFIKKLQALSKNNQIILLLDPDYPGSKIRNLLNNNIPDALNAYINKDLCTNKDGKVGVEYASVKTIKEVLSSIKQKSNNSDITLEFLIDLNYLGAINSKAKRNRLLNKLNLGQANGKTFIKLLQAYGITKDEVLLHET